MSPRRMGMPGVLSDGRATGDEAAIGPSGQLLNEASRSQDGLASRPEGEMEGKDRRACCEERHKKPVPEAPWGRLKDSPVR